MIKHTANRETYDELLPPYHHLLPQTRLSYVFVGHQLPENPYVNTKNKKT